MTVDRTGPAVTLTRFARDGDAVHFVSEGASAVLLRRHRRVIRRMNLAFRIVARLAIRAIALSRGAASANWLALAWRLFGLLRSDFWDELRAAYAEFRRLEPADDISQTAVVV